MDTPPNDKLFERLLEAGIPVVGFDCIDSTNSQARKEPYEAGTLLIAERQSAGRGQRGNRWLSAPGENLTATLLLRPTFLPIERQFLLSCVVALALCDTLESYQIEAQIKWPNDIYVAGKKVAGILIENDLMGATLSRSIVGIGLNINQRLFAEELPNPTSMALCLERDLDRGEVTQRLYEALSHRYGELAEEPSSTIEQAYLQRLYLLGEPARFARSATATTFEGVIEGVEPTGALRIRNTQSTEIEQFLFKEVEYLLPKK